MPPAGFEPAIPASKRPHTHALGRAATGIGYYEVYEGWNFNSGNYLFTTDTK